jgi:hypothetical protein
MGIFLNVDETRRVLYLRFEGLVTDEELLSRYQQALEWNSVHGYQSGVMDFTGVASFKVSVQLVRRIAEHSPVIPSESGGIVTIIAPQDEIFGFARMFEVLGSRTRPAIHVVRSLEAANHLLGVESLDLQPVPGW